MVELIHVLRKSLLQKHASMHSNLIHSFLPAYDPEAVSWGPHWKPIVTFSIWGRLIVHANLFPIFLHTFQGAYGVNHSNDQWLISE